ncbi:MAG TPA: circularly permuted type 2 ATP-grasp protein, partial [Acidimicrobiales bacterium]
MSANPTTELPVGYLPLDGVYDELSDGVGIRPHWGRVARSLGEFGRDDLAGRAAETRRLLVDDGVTYNVVSEGASIARPWVLDPVPVVVAADEWAGIEAGMVQRAELFDLILTDLYGPRRLIADGAIPPEVVYGHPGFLRQCDQIRLPGEHQLFHAAFDLARDRDGTWVVLSDRTQAPSGMGYALENRLVVTRVLPDLYRDAEVVRLAAFFRELRSALQRVAPRAADVPRIAVLTPGPWSETAYEHGSLASYLGYPLVQGPDLRVRDGRVWVRTLGRLEPVDVILRRVDPPWCDPLELKPESTLGAPGLLEACRTGTVSVVNTLGSGVLENPALLPFLPALSEELLGEPLRMPSAATWWCGEPASLSHVVANIDRLVLKSIAEPGRTTVIGSELSGADLAALRARIEAQPFAWVGQEPVEQGSTPTFNGSDLEARRAVLRGFVVSGESGYTVMPGGLTRVASHPDETRITNQNGAWSKDTWVLAREPERLTGFWLQPDDVVASMEPETSMSQRAAENLFWLSRYAERAEDLVRQIRVASDRLLEFAPRTNPAGNGCLAVLLAALTQTSGTHPGFTGDDALPRAEDPGPELRALLVDGDLQGSVAHSVRSLLNAAAQVRDQLSNDTWLVIGHLERDLAALDRLPFAADASALGRVMAAMLALSGLSAESMVRDDGWQFMEAGRRLERALQVCSLLGATITTRRDPATDSLIIESVLTASESIVTYRRRYRSHAQVETMLDLLLLESTNPRSLTYQVVHLAEAVGAMPDAGVLLQHDIDSVVDELRTLVALADTNLLARVDGEDEADLEAIPDASRLRLWAFLGDVSTLLIRLGELLDAAHFDHQLPQRIVAP